MRSVIRIFNSRRVVLGMACATHGMSVYKVLAGKSEGKR
jgi:hypothetical protein